MNLKTLIERNLMMCPKCESKNYGVVDQFDIPGSDESVTIVECKDCGYQES